MKERDVISTHDEEAAQYDQQVREYEYYAHDILFGMSFEYIKARDRLLDIGIGTGLASLPFAKAGLEVFGCDGSAKMLKICESKSFAKELKIFDLRDTPFPYSDGYFNHVISSGVFHFFGELGAIMKEVSRIIKPGGIFAFTVASGHSKENKTISEDPRNYSKMPTSWGVAIFTHSNAYITSILQDNGFDKLKMQKILMRGGEKDCEDMLFRVYIAKRRYVSSSRHVAA
jgi:predicted TPR repeat methyltransferase